MKVKIDIENFLFFQALGSKTRLRILNILLKESKNQKELAEMLDVSTAVISKHLKILKKANLVETFSIAGKKGIQKVCRLIITGYELTYDNQEEEKNFRYNIPIGHFVSCNIVQKKTCGVATKEEILGRCDDSRFFSHPKRYEAAIIWMQSGYINYSLPAYLLDSKNIDSIEISMELCSEAPGINENFLSDIYFHLNDKEIGKWISPGDFGNKKGKYTPKWWYLSEYGLLVTIRINQSGTYINDKKTNDKNISDYNLNPSNDAFFKISSPEDTDYPGGFNIFGEGFGNYEQGIDVKINYK